MKTYDSFKNRNWKLSSYEEYIHHSTSEEILFSMINSRKLEHPGINDSHFINGNELL